MCSEPPFPGLSPTTAYSPLIPTSEQLCGSPLLTTFPQSSNELIFFTFEILGHALSPLFSRGKPLPPATAFSPITSITSLPALPVERSLAS